MRARCGGPAICTACAHDYATWGMRDKTVGKVVQAIAGITADQGTVVATGFLAWLATGDRATLSADEQGRLRDAFFCGAQHVFSSVINMLDEDREPTERDLARMSALHEELQAFERDYIRRVMGREKRQ